MPLTIWNQSAKRNNMSEHTEQAAVVEYIQRKYPNALFWSTPNGAMMGGGRLGALRMNSLKREGLLPGVSDLTIFEPRGKYSAMFLEMKRTKGGVASDNQMWFLREVEKRGAFGVIAYGYDEAVNAVDMYLSGKAK